MKRGIAFVCVLGSCIATSRCWGSELYSSGYSTRALYKLSQTAATATRVGATIGPNGLRDLASDTRPESFRLWGTSITGELYRVDPMTGAGTRVGSFGLPGTEQIRTLAFDTVSGKLY